VVIPKQLEVGFITSGYSALKWKLKNKWNPCYVTIRELQFYRRTVNVRLRDSCEIRQTALLCFTTTV